MADFLRSNTVTKTRKKHRCNWCPEPIEVGESAETQTWADEGVAATAYWHPECFAVVRSYQDFDPHWDDYEPHRCRRGKEFNPEIDY